jgi:hypothetical protein
MGLGDLIIWRTILEIGRSRNAPLLFVSGDQKADWWHQSEGRPLYPRFELVDEYRRASGGRTLHLVTFADFLKLLGASPTIVEEVRKEEQEARAATKVRFTLTSGIHLTPCEITALASIMAHRPSPRSSVAGFVIEKDMQRAGCNDVATGLALTTLERKGFVELSFSEGGNFNEDPYAVYGLSKLGEDWLIDNQSLLALRRQPSPERSQETIGITDDDVPF